MYKLKNSYIDSMISHRLSSCEIDFILYISKFQSEGGTVESVHYREVCEQIGISIQKYYDILHSLSEKGLISYVKNNSYDIAVTLQGNSFSDVDFAMGNTPGYINTAQNRFQDSSFISMKAGSKLLYLYTQRFTKGKHMFVQSFYDEFCRLFNVARKTLQGYMHELKEKKLLFISLKRNRAYHYEMMMKRSTVLYEKGILPQEKSYYEENLVRMMERNFRNYLPEPDGNGNRVALWQIARLATQKRAENTKNFVKLLVRAIHSSIRQQKYEKKKHPVINAALVNKWIPEVERELYGFTNI